MMPLWTTATRSVAIGWALPSVGRPCVAQRVWPMPIVPASGSACEPRLEIAELALGAAALDVAVDQRRDAGRIVAAIFEAPQPSISRGATGALPMMPMMPHMRGDPFKPCGSSCQGRRRALSASHASWDFGT